MDKILHYMHHAMALAEKARGKCSPNPFVGAVLVKNDRIIGEGFTQAYGSDHAEVQAIKNATEDVTGAKLYVTLEPCAHYGKTPPCAKAIIEHKIGSVFAGITDPNPLVNGKGFRMLQEAGIHVQHGFLESEITRQLEYYLCYITKQRPFVTLKTATTLDGRIAASDGTSQWITNELSRQRVHQIRQENDVVLTGIGTVLADNPTLNVRLEHTWKQPVRAILDTDLQLPLDSNIVKTVKQQRTIVFTLDECMQKPQAALLAEQGIELIPVAADEGGLNLTDVLKQLYSQKFYAVMVEAGNSLNSSMLKKQLINKMVIFIAPKLLGGDKTAWGDIGITSIDQAYLLSDTEMQTFGNDICVTAYPQYNRLP